MDLKGIVIKVSKFSLEQFGKGVFHTLQCFRYWITPARFERKGFIILGSCLMGCSCSCYLCGHKELTVILQMLHNLSRSLVCLGNHLNVICAEGISFIM